MHASHSSSQEVPAKGGVVAVSGRNRGIRHIDLARVFTSAHDARMLALITTFDLSRNDIVELTHLQALASLQRLDASYNVISVLGGLPLSLTFLDISHNKLTDLNGLGHLPNLQELDVSFNRLTDMSGLRGECSLRVLRACSNRLVSPAGLDDKPFLRVLALDDNCIASVDDLAFLFSTPCLQVLSLRNNAVTQLRGYRRIVGSMQEAVLSLDGVPLLRCEEEVGAVPSSVNGVSTRPSRKDCERRLQKGGDLDSKSNAKFLRRRSSSPSTPRPGVTGRKGASDVTTANEMLPHSGVWPDDREPSPEYTAHGYLETQDENGAVLTSKRSCPVLPAEAHARRANPLPAQRVSLRHPVACTSSPLSTSFLQARPEDEKAPTGGVLDATPKPVAGSTVQEDEMPSATVKRCSTVSRRQNTYAGKEELRWRSRADAHPPAGSSVATPGPSALLDDGTSLRLEEAADGRRTAALLHDSLVEKEQLEKENNFLAGRTKKLEEQLTNARRVISEQLNELSTTRLERDAIRQSELDLKERLDRVKRDMKSAVAHQREELKMMRGQYERSQAFYEAQLADLRRQLSKEYARTGGSLSKPAASPPPLCSVSASERPSGVSPHANLHVASGTSDAVGGDGNGTQASLVSNLSEISAPSSPCTPSDGESAYALADCNADVTGVKHHNRQVHVPSAKEVIGVVVCDAHDPGLVTDCAPSVPCMSSAEAEQRLNPHNVAEPGTAGEGLNLGVGPLDGAAPSSGLDSSRVLVGTSAEVDDGALRGEVTMRREQVAASRQVAQLYARLLNSAVGAGALAGAVEPG